MKYTKNEELANVITHAIAMIYGIIGAYILVPLAFNLADNWAIVSTYLYLFGMLASYSTSILYHATVDAKKKSILRKYDHAAIYLHIAGTYTPFTLFVLREVGLWGWILTVVIWIAAITGTTLSFLHKKAGSKLETVCYVLMGCVILIAIKPLIDTLSATNALSAFYWLIGGGISYIIGAVLYSFKKIKYMHAVFHLFVFGGTICHIFAIKTILS